MAYKSNTSHISNYASQIKYITNLGGFNKTNLLIQVQFEVNTWLSYWIDFV